MDSWQSLTAASQQFVRVAVERCDATLIALDFDGTLAPIVDDPERSQLLPEAAEALGRLGEHIQLAIITGRPAATVRRLGRLEQRRGLERLVVLGQYGAERWDAATGKQTIPERCAGIARALQDITEAIVRLGLEGVHLEDKHHALVVHTRRAAHPQHAFEQLLPVVSGIGEQRGLRLEPGRHVLELRSSNRTKGEALMDLAQEMSAVAVAMCGDDLGDIPAFEALTELASRGIATCAVVSASREQPGMARYADVLADGPMGVAAWLASVAEAVERLC